MEILDLKVFVYLAIGLLLFVRFIINKAIFNRKNMNNFSTYTSRHNSQRVIDYFNAAFIFWIKPEKDIQTKAWISNSLLIIAILLFIYYLTRTISQDLN